MNTITTERLVLRNFQASDAEALFEYLQAPTASCFFSLKLDTLAAAQDEAMKRAASDEMVAVCLKDSGQLVGDLFAHPDPKWPDDPETLADTVSVGWNFNPHFGGKGYALEAAKALCADLFANHGTRRIYAYVEDHNSPSRRLCEKLGMRQEGLFREFVSFQNDDNGDPVYENTMQYAILKREWQDAHGI